MITSLEGTRLSGSLSQGTDLQQPGDYQIRGSGVGTDRSAPLTFHDAFPLEPELNALSKGAGLAAYRNKSTNVPAFGFADDASVAEENRANRAILTLHRRRFS